MKIYTRRYQGKLAALIVDDHLPAEGWCYAGAGERASMVAFARAAKMFPIFAPRSGRYADIADSIQGYEAKLA